ncbi:MAG: SDR family oxidoreductase [Clostridiales bacterium]|nr:SDR family oxidoreductase [Clostridiales bacterium]
MIYNNRIAIVTGASGGIGGAVARKLCEDGFDTVLHYNSSEDSVRTLENELKQKGYRVMTAKADVSKSSEVNDMIEYIAKNFGSPYLLVNNAGIAQQKLFTFITDEDWNKMIGVNLTGVFNMSRAVIPFMVHKKQGVIINIASMWGEVGASCEVHYSASKSGVIGMTKALAKEVAPSGIRVNCVSPGAVDTEMMSSFSAEDIAALCEEIPLGRLGKPEEVAYAVSFLASDRASYITGQTLSVCGGMTI